MAATKLHELLAVKDSLRTQAEATRSDLQETFEKKRTHFSEKTVTFKSLTEGVEDKVESQLGLQTTVAKELAWIGEKISKAIDVAAQVDEGNTTARADVVLEDGTVLLRSIPATTLLELEKRMKEIQDLVQKIPTLDPSSGFAPDAERGDGIYRARDVEKPRTEKQFRFIVMVPPTDKHPAQVKELMEDKPIGRTIHAEWSGLISVADKGDMLDRIEGLSRAIKKARSRANDSEVNVNGTRLGAVIWSYVTNVK